ncbi:MAG TPA: ABC transporter ATP-binding protein [Vicinamibacterales bacterium]|jgi:ATP-binding cassette subfamily B protein|nr:ABC transporter ATP-binding protein [Vicinamibacterales bacterium]
MTPPGDLERRRLPAALRLVVRRYAAQVRRQPWVAIPALVLPGFARILDAYAPPLVVARLLGAFARQERLTAGELAPYVLAFAGVWLLGEVLWRIALVLVTRAEIRGLEALYIEAMDELLAKDLAFFQDNFAGSLTKRALGYARRFEDVFDVLFFSVSTNLIPLAFVAVVLWFYSPLLIVVLIGMLAGTFALVFPLIRRRQRLVDLREAASNVMAGHLADSIANAEAVRAFAREPEEARVHTDNVMDLASKTKRSWDYQNLRIDTITAPMHVLTNTLGLIIALVTSRGTGASLETVFITFSYYTAATRVMWEFNRIYRNLESALTDAAQFAELLLEPPSVVDSGTQAFTPADFSVELREVSYRYSPTHPLLFDGFSLRLDPGAKVGLVGRSGGGKTTLTRLLLRFADVERGEILIGGQPVERVPLSRLRDTIGYVPQDPSMFHRTIADNIRFGRPAASDAAVREAARLAHAAEFIEGLPMGYGTLVGERGVKLSGGQRQRIAIARAILKDAPILILDEATSSLDSESEALIQDALWALMANRTTLVIAHRLSTVRRMDRLVVLDRGRIVEEGPHADLLAREGIYHSLWTHQSGGFLGGDADDQDRDGKESYAI